MPDDQGFDWSALLQSATPYAAALIPAAVGAIAGGKGAAGIGAATGFAEGMRGQVLTDQEYQKQLAQVQEANQRAAIAQQEQALRVQEFRIRAQNLDRQNQIAEAQIPHLEEQTRELKQKREYYQLTEQHQLKFADDNLRGVEKEAYLAMPSPERGKFQEKWLVQQQQARTLPGLIAQARAFGMPMEIAQAHAADPKGFDDLRDFIDKNIIERNKPQAPGVTTEISGNFKDANGNPLIATINHRTGMTEFKPLPAGITREGKALTAPQEQALIDKRKKDFIGGFRPGTQEYQDKLAEWEGSPYQNAAVNIEDPNKYSEEVTKLKKLDATGMADAKKAYLSTPVGTPGISGKPSNAKPTEEGFQEYIQTPQGKEFLESYKELARTGSPAPRAAPPAGKPSATQAPSGTVLMQAPDGSQRSVPKDRVEEFKKKGAKIVGK